MIPWAIAKMFLSRNGIAFGLVAVIGFQYVWFNRQIGQMRRDNAALQQEVQRSHGAIERLNENIARLRPGESRTEVIKVPEFIFVDKQVPVIVTRTEKTIETKVQTLTLPPEKIKEIIEKAVQSLVLDVTATRDIKAGEKFRIVASQIQPGVWQGLLEPGAPVTVDVTTVTPVDRIPQIQAMRNLTITFYAGFSSQDGVVAGARAHYKLTPTFGVEGSAECQGIFTGCSNKDFRLLGTVTW